MSLNSIPEAASTDFSLRNSVDLAIENRNRVPERAFCTPDRKPHFNCPRCITPLASTRKGFHCAQCSSDFPVEDGIVDLRCGRRDYYFNPVPRKEMAQLIEDAAHEPWRSTVRRFLASVRDNPDWLDDLVIDGRYSWKLFLDLPSDATFLDLGCGLGNLVKNIAPHTGRCFAMDLTWERLQFAKHRFAQFNPNDDIVLVAGGDGPHLPFPDAYFDCVSLSGVLEWIPDDGSWKLVTNSKYVQAMHMALSIFGKSNPRTMQVRLLQELRRIIKPSGQIFVAIENRVNHEYFGARPDHHSRLWFASLLPRQVANLFSILVNRRPYRTYTYSWGGFRRLFREGGFDNHEVLGFLHGYRMLTEIVPLNPSEGSQWRAARKASLRERITKNRFFVPAYGMIGSTSRGKHESLLRQVVKMIEQSLPEPGGPLSIESCNVTQTETTVFRGTAGTSRIVITIPANEAAAKAQARHYDLLCELRGVESAAPFIPNAITRGSIRRIDYFVESELPGQPLRTHLARHDRTVLLAGVSRLLRALNPRPETLAKIRFSDTHFDRLVATPLNKVVSALDDQELAREVLKVLGTRLHGIPLVLGLTHGTFGVDALQIHGTTLSGLTDWDNADSAGLPGLDAIGYVLSVHQALNPDLPTAQAIALLARGAWPVEAESQFLRESFEYLGFDATYQKELVALWWLHSICSQLEFSLAYSRPEIDRKIIRPARELLRLL